MAEINENCNIGCDFKEACCIDAGRLYDSCCDRDCLEDLRCFFTAEAQAKINNAMSVKLRSAEVVSAAIDVEPVNFNRGFYSCNITFYFVVELEVCNNNQCCPTIVKGATCFNKRVILFGSDGNVKVFTSAINGNGCGCNDTADSTSNMPRCVVQSVDPIALSSRVGVIRDCYDSVCVFPKEVTEILGGCVVTDLPSCTPTVYVTLGLFTVVQLIRQVQMLVPVYDFCIPEKQCTDTTDQPCDVFRRIKFPTDDFFPPRPYNIDDGCGCGCKDND